MNWQKLEAKALRPLILLCLIWQLIVQQVHGHALRLLPDQMKEFSCGTLYYRTFFLDLENHTLYVGAMNRIFRVNLWNVNTTDCNTPSYKPASYDLDSCQIKLKSAFECQNHIRVIHKIGAGDRLYICGTNAFNPKDFVVNARNLLPLKHQPPLMGAAAARCPFDPADNATAIWIENGTPFGLPALYSGTISEFTRASSVIFRPALYFPNGTRAANYIILPNYSKIYLNDPNFVGSFNVGDYVYFFYRERALEYLNCGKIIYSRIARLCKKDTGAHLYPNDWSTYLKARLICSIPGDYPFYFNEIQSVYKIPGNDTMFYATFTTSPNGLMGSAICLFNYSDIEAAFNGRFKEQLSSQSAWLPVSKAEEPEPRPGTCVNDTQTLTDNVLTFVKDHPLMDSAVQHRFNRPIFYKSDIVFVQLVVTKSGEYTIYFAGTDTGMIYKIVQWEEHKTVYSKLVSMFEATTPEPIKNMQISTHHASIYVASDSKIRQIDLVLCKGHYDSCAGCVQDPDCGWNKATQKCQTKTPTDTELLQDVKNDHGGICEDSVNWTTMDVFLGQSAHLKCQVKMPIINSPVVWLRNNTPIRNSAKHVYTQDNGLVVMDIDQRDAGKYECRVGMDVLCRHTVNIDAETCRTPKDENDYRQVYKDWCNEFQKYKREMKKWESNKKSCYKHPNET